jgi:hypothetical protein
VDVENASGLLFVATDLDAAHEREINHWYDTRHVPQREALPGFLSAQRFVRFEGGPEYAQFQAGPKYVALYDLENPEVMQRDAYAALSRPPIVTDEDREMLKGFQHTVRAVMVEILRARAQSAADARAQAGGLLVVGLKPHDSYEEELNAWYDEEHVPYLLQAQGVLGVRRFRAVEGEPAYLALWELEKPEVRATAEFAKMGNTPWTRRVLAHCDMRVRGLYIPLSR